jgi:hypothetical protein
MRLQRVVYKEFYFDALSSLRKPALPKLPLRIDGLVLFVTSVYHTITCVESSISRPASIKRERAYSDHESSIKDHCVTGKLNKTISPNDA